MSRMSAAEKAAEIRSSMEKQNGVAPEVDKPVAHTMLAEQTDPIQSSVEPMDEPAESHISPGETESPDYKALYEKAEDLRKKAEVSYSELRSHADRVSSDNSRLTRELNVLSKVDKADNSAVDSSINSSEATVEAITERQEGESYEDFEQRINLIVEDYPDFKPFADGILRQEKRMDSLQSQIDTQIMPVVDSTKDQMAEDVRDREQEDQRSYYKAIKDAHPNAAEIVRSDAFDIFLRNHRLGRVYSQMIFPNTEAGEVGGSAVEVIAIFDEFNQSNPASQDDIAQQHASANRVNAAQEDDVGEIPRSPARPEVIGDINIPTAQQVQAWSKDPKLFKQHKAEIYAYGQARSRGVV